MDIYGETGTTIRVSYALVKSLLVDGTAQLRVEADGTVCSDPITITVSEADANAAVAIPEVGADHVVLPAPEATVYEVSQPTGETAGTVDVAALEAAVTEAQSAYLAAKEASDAVTAAYDAAVVAAETDASEEAKTTLAAAEAEKAAADQNLADAEAAFDAAMAAYNEAAGTAVAVAAETPDLNEYTVVVNYVFENNVIVADPYTATLAAGSNFSATVNHPAVMGYLPYVGDANETSTGIDLNITNIQADVTYTVTYKPTNVNYTVIHYWQNVDNDNYTIHETETLQGLTKSTVGEVAKAYPGMYALLYERPEIAADGSTVVEVYYDRNYYMMFFNLGEGGYGVDPVIYARYGAPVEIDEPTRPGYTFNGWDKDVPDTVPVDGGSYTAQWESSTTSFTVVYWYENADDDKYTSVGSVTVNNVASGSQVTSETYKDNSFENRDDDHFTYNPDKSETKTVDGDGSTVLNVYFTRNEYTITFTGVRGELTCTRTEHETEPRSSMKGRWWVCQCSCGNIYICPGSLLVTGKRTHCGCKTDRGRPADITGKKFNRLTALYISKRNDPKDGVVWRCRCDCGNEVDVPYNNLVFCNQKSCGCRKKEHDKKLSSFLTHVAGTSVDMLKSKKVPTDNTTGYKGVYLIKGKYVAKIVFQKKAYYLGTYDNIADAAQARKEAEEVLFDGVAEHYAKWKEKADTDPSWAEENPIQIFVSQNSDKRLSLALLPILNAETY